MKQMLRTLLASAMMIGAASAVTAQAPAYAVTQQDAADLSRLDGTLNATETFTGNFVQTNGDGSVQTGKVYIQRPGKLRFEYDGSLLVVSDGVTLVQADSALETSDRVPLSSTPLEFFLKNDVNLARDTQIVGFAKTGTEWAVSAVDGFGNVDGVITLVFDATTLALKSWIIDDSFGATTRVDLRDLRYNAQLDPRLFVLRDERRDGRRR